MSEIVTSFLAFIVAISVLVAIHEFGHFWVARKLGIKVLRFSIGFGKPFWIRIFGADKTEFAVAAIPLGGYVKMLDEREGEVPEQDRHRAFNRQPLWSRSAVLIAGPLFNFLFAIAAYWLMFSYGVPGLKPVIGEINDGSYAASAGLKAGDEFIKIGGADTQTWDTALTELLDAALGREQVDIEVRNTDGGDRIVSLDLRNAPDILDKGGLLGNLGLSVMRPRIPADIEKTVPGSPAETAGLISGDRIISADNQNIENWNAWVDFVRVRPDQDIQVSILRDGAEMKLQLRPKSVMENDKAIGQIGAYVRQPESVDNPLRVKVRYGPLAAVEHAVVKTWDMSALTLRTLWGMVTGRASIENISGPLSIAQYAGYSAKTGFASFLKFLAIVSISLGVLNLLPIPILDGGHLLYNAIEWVSGKPLSMAAQEVGQRIGIVAMLGLMSLAFYNDISRLFFNS
ncbi:MAG: RIP metalloprotease RseP [Gammaproteobacteria bacterium]